MSEYAEATASAERFDEYLRRYVHEPRDHFEYLDRIGAERLARLSDIASLL